MNIEQIDWKKIYLIPEKKSGYRFAYNMSKFKFITPTLYIPFGVELYNKKEILNIMINENNNEKHNFIHYISTIENIYHQFSQKNNDKELPFVYLPPNFISDVRDKEFIKTLKPNLDNYLLRTHIKNADIYKIMNNKKILMEKKDIVKKKCKCEIELSNVWIHGDKYGLIWTINKIEIVD